ncbi:putative baseplate assembly protein, partial [Georgenia sp. 10Sc9-8]|nr:putative baseplate assembly protein [Georgenia halotolerans]
DLDEAPAGGAPRVPPPWQAGRLLTAPPAVLWELWQGPNPPGDPLAVLDVDGDTTLGMTTTGVVTLSLPQVLPAVPRGTVPAGGRRSPPPLEDPKEAAKVVAWLRARRPTGENDAIHRVRWVGLNAVRAEQARTATPELLGWGDGDPDQSFALTQRPVLPGSLQLDVEETGGWRRWQEVETLALSRSGDRHYSVDPTTGVVRFGATSRAPQLGERVRALTYRYGGGADGNVPAGAVTSFSGVASATVTNVLPAAGGADAASLPEALAEVPARVHRRDRAVTGDDFRALALEVPGVRRAETLPLFHPDTPTVRRPGAVSVLVLPTEDLRDPAAPLPDTALLRRVAAYLDPRRLATTELYVIPPTYRQVAVSVGVHVADGYQVDAVRRWVELLLRQYLAPVPDFGPAGQGWPLGRAVRRAELEAIAVQVEGIDYVVDRLQLAARRPGPSTEPPAWDPTDVVELAPWQLPQLAAITVVGGSPLPVGSGYSAPHDDDTDPVIVPLPPDVCR